MPQSSQPNSARGVSQACSSTGLLSGGSRTRNQTATDCLQQTNYKAASVPKTSTRLDEAAQRLAVGGHEELLVGVHNVVALGTPKVVLQNGSGNQSKVFYFLLSARTV